MPQLISGVRGGPRPLILNEWNGFVVIETQWLQTALGLCGVKTTKQQCDNLTTELYEVEEVQKLIWVSCSPHATEAFRDTVMH